MVPSPIAKTPRPKLPTADRGGATALIAKPPRKAETKAPNRDLLHGGDTSFAKGLAPMENAVVEELESKHAALHALIEEEEHRTVPDEDLLHRLKKEKLRLKDELAGHTTEH
ncbi:MAG: YdcH family protein [Pseudomonadota bacterium]